MIFKNDAITLKNDESYKERNLYYKIFAGYLLNELIPGYEERKLDFLKLLTETICQPERFFGDKDKTDEIIVEIQKAELRVTFDYHSAQIFEEDKRDDRGEMSDVLILSGNHMLSIECKFLSNINFDKDIIEVQKRIAKFSDHFNLKPIQILLLKKEKWNNSKRIKNELKNIPGVSVIVLFWEDLLLLFKHDQVKNYLDIQINRKQSYSATLIAVEN